MLLWQLIGPTTTLLDEQAMSEQEMPIEFVIDLKSKGTFSLDIGESDYLENEVILSQVLATLVKIESSGHYKPFLAKSWVVSPDEKIWEFVIRPDFRDEKGTLITASAFVADLKKTLILLKPKAERFWFSNLKGWENFSHESQNLEGVVVEENKIIFKFERKPARLLNFLRMPYFGYWGPNRDIKDPSDFISSGSSKIIDFGKNVVEMVQRQELPSIKSGPPGRYKFSMRPVTLEEFKNSKMVVLTSESENEIFKGSSGHFSLLPPEILETVVLAPLKDGPFQNEKYRKHFASAVRAYLHRQALQKNDVLVKTFFGMGQLEDDVQPERLPPIDSDRRELRVLAHRSWERGVPDQGMDLLHQFLVENGIKHKIVAFPDLKALNLQPYANDYFDLRMSGVSAGSGFSTSVVEMMFCTQLGISFPDPEGSVCSLVLESSKEENSDFAKYSQKLNDIVLKENYVIPIKRYGFVLNFSPKANFKQYPEASLFFDFNDLEPLD